MQLSPLNSQFVCFKNKRRKNKQTTLFYLDKKSAYIPCHRLLIMRGSIRNYLESFCHWVWKKYYLVESGLPSLYKPLISTHWIGNDRFDCEVTWSPSCCTQKDRYTPHERIIIIQCFDGNRSEEPIKYVFSLLISDKSLLLKLSMRKTINSKNKLPGEHARKYVLK